jgi:hypothetical protein
MFVKDREATKEELDVVRGNSVTGAERYLEYERVE